MRGSAIDGRTGATMSYYEDDRDQDVVAGSGSARASSAMKVDMG